MTDQKIHLSMEVGQEREMEEQFQVTVCYNTIVQSEQGSAAKTFLMNQLRL